MKTIVCLRDRIAGHFMQPMFVPSEGIASRHVGDEIKRGGEGNVLASHPGDFEMYRLGIFDEETGAMVLEGKPVFILQVSALVEVKDVY